LKETELLTDWQISREEELRNLPREEFLERLRKEVEPLDQELRSLGLVTGIFFWNIRDFEQREKYRVAVPLILRFLQRPLTDRAKAGTAQLLCENVPEVRDSWPEIVKLYKAEPSHYEVVREGKLCRQELRAKDSLANTVIASFTPKRLPELLELVQDRSQGGSRTILLHILKRRKDHTIDTILNELLHDPDLAHELSQWKRLSAVPRVS
jgi:antitoxin component HigA of HigAB toxin-antitoxin module